jgi:hypothetical protein
MSWKAPPSGKLRGIPLSQGMSVFWVQIPVAKRLGADIAVARGIGRLGDNGQPAHQGTRIKELPEVGESAPFPILNVASQA